MNLPRPKISVVTGCFNDRNALAATLDSVLSQQGVDLEYVIVDDGSTDDSGSVLRRYQKTDARLRVARVELNRGLTQALIRGCELAQGEYIARHDVGDVSLPGRLQRQAALLDNTPDAAFVCCGYRMVGPGGELLQEVPGCDGVAATRVLREARPERLVGPHHGTVMFRKSSYQAAGGYREHFYYTQDLDLWTRMAEIGSMACVTELLYEVGFTYGSISDRHLPQQQRLKALIAEATQLRRDGESEDDVLRQVSAIRPNGTSEARQAARDAEAAYFVGSCLARRGDPAAASYFLETLRRRPWHLKAWVKLAHSALRSSRLADMEHSDG